VLSSSFAALYGVASGADVATTAASEGAPAVGSRPPVLRACPSEGRVGGSSVALQRILSRGASGVALWPGVSTAASLSAADAAAATAAAVTNRTRLVVASNGVLLFATGACHVAAVDTTADPAVVPSLQKWIQTVQSGVLVFASPLPLTDSVCNKENPHAASGLLQVPIALRTSPSCGLVMNAVCASVLLCRRCCSGSLRNLVPDSCTWCAAPAGMRRHRLTIPACLLISLGT
jgi:hypothetical protein